MSDSTDRATLRGAALLAAVVAVDVALLATGRYAMLPFPGLVTLAWFYLLLSARRSFTAVGEGWLYQRSEAFGAGKWCTFSSLRTIRVRKGARGRLYVELRAPNMRARLWADQPGNAYRTEVARQALASPAVIDDEGRRVLRGWLSWSATAPTG